MATGITSLLLKKIDLKYQYQVITLNVTAVTFCYLTFFGGTRVKHNVPVCMQKIIIYTTATYKRAAIAQSFIWLSSPPFRILIFNKKQPFKYITIKLPKTKRTTPFNFSVHVYSLSTFMVCVPKRKKNRLITTLLRLNTTSTNILNKSIIIPVKYSSYMYCIWSYL